jgi:hypothetical protein
MLSYHDSNYERKFNTVEFYDNIMNQVSSKLKRPLEISEKKQVTTFIRKIDPNILKPMYKDKTIPIMIDTLVKEFSSFKCGESLNEDTKPLFQKMIGKSSESGTTHGIYDNPSYGVVTRKPSEAVQQTPNQEFKIQELFGIKSASEICKILNPMASYRKNYMVLDSRYRNTTEQSPPSVKSFEWNYVQKNQNTIQGSVNVIGNVRDIVGFRVYPFRIPYVANADNSYSRITMLIEELASQAFIAHENRKFQFMLKSTVDNEFIDLDTDNFNDGYFWFEKPITTLEKLTISFGNPLEKIIFDRDRDFCGIDYFTIAPATQITTEKTHNLANGDLVYFEDFDVGAVNPLLTNQVVINNNIKILINQGSGHQITVINPTTFSIAAVTNTIQNPIANIRFKVFYGSKRAFIPIEIIYMKPDSDDLLY